MSEYFEQVSPTYIENWPRELCSMSIAQIDIPLTIQEADNLGSHIAEYGETFNRTGDLTIITNRVIQAVRKFPNGAFVRLGSRSPKDAWLALKQGSMKVETPEGPVILDNHPLRFMLDCSERVSDDLHLAIANNYAPHIFVRQWIDIEKWQEFRCFMVGRLLKGISQYFYMDGRMLEIVENEGGIRWAIEEFFVEFRKAFFSTDLWDVVFDVIVFRKQVEHRSYIWEVKLLEINPFGPMTDPCLFRWVSGNGDFDGSFRYV